MRLTAVLSCLVISLAAASTAKAGLVVAFKKNDSISTIKTKIEENLKHTRYVCNEGKGKPKRTHCQATRWLEKWLAQISTPVFYVPHYSDWMCIHKFEGSWSDSGDPYWGGLQMDRGFMEHFAPAWLLRKGFANSWTPIEQMWVAERAYKESGFSRWPNTARYCGLL